jgi:NADPH-ferrihemoprotein reductase
MVQDEYLRWVQHDMRTFAEVIRDLPTLRPDPGHMVEMLPKLQCRYYSISSSPKAHPGSVHVTAVVVEYRTPLGREAKGVATTYLRGLDCSGAGMLHTTQHAGRGARRGRCG